MGAGWSQGLTFRVQGLGSLQGKLTVRVSIYMVGASLMTACSILGSRVYGG